MTRTLQPSIRRASARALAAASATALALGGCEGRSLTLDFPGGGERVEAGQPMEVHWQSRGSIDAVDLELLRGDRRDRVVAAGVPDSGRFLWVVDPDQAAGDDYRLRVRASGDPSVAAESDGPFTILERRTITVQAPAADPIFPGPNPIAWTTTGDIRAVHIELRAGGGPVATLAERVDDTGAFTWSVPYGQPAGEGFGVRVSDAADPAVWGESPEPFAMEAFAFARPITVTSHAGETLVDHPVQLSLGGAFAHDRLREDGGDLRFVTALDGAAPHLAHWIESWNDGGESRVWVRLPQLEPDAALELHMVYGNPIAPDDGADFPALFPDAVVTTGDLLLGGELRHDWFELSAGTTLRLVAGEPLRIEAHRIIIAGTIDGAGAGHRGGEPSEPQAPGPGGGGRSFDGGGGGGGYGGLGGRGGYDPGDTPGTGGGSYGDGRGFGVEMGSGGGAAAMAGGAGGGAVWLEATALSIPGAVHVDGARGWLVGTGSGGGSGGGALLAADRLDVTGEVTARGGAGGEGQIPADDGGGGGGGGRVKLFFAEADGLAGTLDASGGKGGDHGFAEWGQDGTDGTIEHVQVAPAIGVEVGDEVEL